MFVFNFLWNSLEYGRSRTKYLPLLNPIPLTSKLQRHLPCHRKIWIIYKKKHFPRNFKNPKKFWKSEKNWNSHFQNFEKIDLIILPNRSNRSNRKNSLNRLDRFIGQRINTCNCRGVEANCRRYMRTWHSPYEIIGDGNNEGGHRYQPLDRFILRELWCERCL